MVGCGYGDLRCFALLVTGEGIHPLPGVAPCFQLEQDSLVVCLRNVQGGVGLVHQGIDLASFQFHDRGFFKQAGHDGRVGGSTVTR